MHRKKPKLKAAFADTLEYQGTPGTMAHPAEMGETELEVKKVIKVSLDGRKILLRT